MLGARGREGGEGRGEEGGDTAAVVSSRDTLLTTTMLLLHRNKYNRRFVNKVEGFGKKGPNSNAGQAS